MMKFGTNTLQCLEGGGGGYNSFNFWILSFVIETNGVASRYVKGCKEKSEELDL